MQILSTQPSDRLNVYPEKKVHRTFILSGTLFQLILFPFAATLFTADASIGLMAILFFPIYILGGCLFGLAIMSIVSTWHVHKKRFIKKGWWIQTFSVGYLITTVFYVIFLSSMIGILPSLAIGLAGGVSAVLAGMSALPTAPI
ncbi:hypothetical protein AAJP47_03955 [Psychrobacter sp. B38]|uniref:hypothetical protein n=1 Tax=Psychrobacter sp. B38 TaxID=3143538 RepID=UPI00320D11CE